jgi:O-antigen ligase
LLEEIRLYVWRSALEMIADHPWLGVGLDGFRPLYPRYMQVEAWREPVLFHPHNMWLDAAVRTGLPGLVLFLALVTISLRILGRWARHATGWQQALAVGCVAAMLGGLAHGLVDSGYFLPDLAWSLALMGGLAQMALREDGVDMEGGL